MSHLVKFLGLMEELNESERDPKKWLEVVGVLADFLDEALPEDVQGSARYFRTGLRWLVKKKKALKYDYGELTFEDLPKSIAVHFSGLYRNSWELVTVLGIAIEEACQDMEGAL